LGHVKTMHGPSVALLAEKATNLCTNTCCRLRKDKHRFASVCNNRQRHATDCNTGLGVRLLQPQARIRDELLRVGFQRQGDAGSRPRLPRFRPCGVPIQRTPPGIFEKLV
jgi:hypothetical protein